LRNIHEKISLLCLQILVQKYKYLKEIISLTSHEPKGIGVLRLKNKDSKIHKSDLRILNATNADTNTPKENPKQNVAIGNKLISKFFEFWWLVIIGLIIGAIILNIEYKWFVSKLPTHAKKRWDGL